ncbi:hypothetical protein EVAR_48869_1 [Eumeta japonica]|uniref:Uncharacterized protein n=1 Tax=Eumeta variegata TaxID=151549 RepID=A0A4C1Y7M5_EUMVA|nr:hypothetical protein EVAR_48869_1 [Eumeta japonica]
MQLIRAGGCPIYELQRNRCIRCSCTPTATCQARAAIKKFEHLNAVHHFAHTPPECVLRGDCEEISKCAYSAVLKSPLQSQLPCPSYDSSAFHRLLRIAYCAPPRNPLRYPASAEGAKGRWIDAEAAGGELSKASLGFELLLAMKHHAKQLFITDLQNSSAVASISVTNFVMVAPVHRYVDVVRRMIGTDRHMTYHEIRAALDIGMNQIQSILHKYLDMKRLCSRWIPHSLTKAQKWTAALGAMLCLPDSRKGCQIWVGTQ